MTLLPPEGKPVSHRKTIHRLLINQLLWMLFLRVVLYTLILGISAYLQSGQFNVIVLPPAHLFFFIILVYATSIGSGLFLLKANRDPRRFGLEQILLDTFFISSLVYYTGASQSIFSPIFFFPIIAGGLILPRLGGLIAAGATTLQFAVVLILEYYKIFPDFLRVPLYDNARDILATLNLFAVYGLTFFLAAILSSLFAGRLRRTEDALSDSVRDFGRLSLLYKQIFDDISTGIVTTDDRNRITSVNNAAAQITGYSVDELLDEDFHSIFPNVSFTDQGSRHSAELQRKDGEPTRIGYSYAKLQYNQPAKNYKDTDDFCANCRVITIQDISEVERLEKQMQQAEKLAAIGRMSAGIAHDFRNPLTAISGSAQVLANELSQMQSSQQETNTELITIILRESNRLSNTVSDFLKFARPENAENDWFSLKRCLNEVLEVARMAASWPEKCVLDIDIDSVVDIWADQYQLFTILNHLLQNALAFTPLGDEKIRIKAVEIKGEDGADTIQITVEDNGPGITPGKEEKIFEPFYTRRVDGTGLGLAIVKQMMTEHNGSIEVGKSSLGGAKFTVNFPLP
ncbi:PAS domain S-box [Desulfocapsa sulfexigens DSM 10523]|uniref:histidine kinase n=1 Tax=Desulfocapsa sulfexigens (strain DSM 10523 / SB164P1) TaxID=1167006 RepID=M1P6H6_DESSD|nr:ATP-binding protein [Desulfocapsa sulfexigens]AGF79043.1 PAS domain S-box [Desulfocapsa sulfexigens DSM 10523]